MKGLLIMSDIQLSLEIEKFGILKIELYPNEAPNTVANFINYVTQNFYDGLIFHRIIKGFMIQWHHPHQTIDFLRWGRAANCAFEPQS